MKKYVSKNFWVKYWESKQPIKKLTRRHFFRTLFETHFIENEGKTLIEVGGFPGTYAVYLAKYFGFKTTLLDYVENKKLLHEIMRLNNVDSNRVQSMKADFLNYQAKNRYDAVVSFGFVEHFDDTKEIIRRHVALCKSGGKLLIAIPNFLGLNGSIQKKFDPENLKVHNLRSMDIKVLHEVMSKQNVKEYSIDYYGGLLIWLEKMHTKPLTVRIFFFVVNCIGLCLKFFGFNSKWSSPYIIITATK